MPGRRQEFDNSGSRPLFRSGLSQKPFASRPCLPMSWLAPVDAVFGLPNVLPHRIGGPLARTYNIRGAEGSQGGPCFGTHGNPGFHPLPPALKTPTLAAIRHPGPTRRSLFIGACALPGFGRLAIFRKAHQEVSPVRPSSVCHWCRRECRR